MRGFDACKSGFDESNPYEADAGAPLHEGFDACKSGFDESNPYEADSCVGARFIAPAFQALAETPTMPIRA